MTGTATDELDVSDSESIETALLCATSPTPLSCSSSESRILAKALRLGTVDFRGFGLGGVGGDLAFGASLLDFFEGVLLEDVVFFGFEPEVTAGVLDLPVPDLLGPGSGLVREGL